MASSSSRGSRNSKAKTDEKTGTFGYRFLCSGVFQPPQADEDGDDAHGFGERAADGAAEDGVDHPGSAVGQGKLPHGHIIEVESNGGGEASDDGEELQQKISRAGFHAPVGEHQHIVDAVADAEQGKPPFFSGPGTFPAGKNQGPADADEVQERSGDRPQEQIMDGEDQGGLELDPDHRLLPGELEG